MTSTELAAAVARVRTVFAGMTSPDEKGCGYCHNSLETALLRTPHVTVPVETVGYYLLEVADHFTDHAASMRRLLPDLVAYLASGELHAWTGSVAGLAASGWQQWPAEQRDAVSGFLLAWWDAHLHDEDPVHPVEKVFQMCVTATSSLTPYLDHWAAQPPGGLPDDRLASVAEEWIQDLLYDDSVIEEWRDWQRDQPDDELVAWLVDVARPRLAAHGADPELVRRIGLLPLPYDERWDAYYGRDADSATAAETS
ncbi:hypothetical protein AB0M39_29075 [Streptomyces sp. NPDC051907]|uniref:hypothetical protein n=1 Tax=Streptomyces sp. NPDC051907 TaxID=3155284 RepID=UPI003417E439